MVYCCYLATTMGLNKYGMGKVISNELINTLQFNTFLI
jgi:hypothetical protein